MPNKNLLAVLSVFGLFALFLVMMKELYTPLPETPPKYYQALPITKEEPKPPL